MILGFFGGNTRPQPEQNLSEFDDLGFDYVEIDDAYFKQDDEYFELCRLRDEEVESEDFDFDSFLLEEDEPENDDDDDFNFDDFLEDTWGQDDD